MKKIILLLISLLIISGCEKKEETKNNIDNDDIKEEIVEKYVDNNPIKIGIYDKNKLVTNYETDFIDGTDLALFDIYYTNLEYVDNKSTKINWKKYYSEYENIENYKTGFYIKFEADGKVFEETILDCTKTHSMYPYLFVYLYDDVNQPDYTYYSHVEEMNGNTIFSSIKLYLSSDSINITSPITFTVFTYDDMDDFDEFNHYRGNSSYTISISRSN